MKWQSPYFDEGTWLRGNLHTHTVASDGHYDLEQTAFFYGKNCTYKRNPRMNYRFLAITDHTTDAKRELFKRPETTEDGFILIEGREDSYSHHILGIGCRMTFQEDIVGKPKGTYTLEDNQRVIDKILEDGGIAVLAHPHWASQDTGHATTRGTCRATQASKSSTATCFPAPETWPPTSGTRR